MKDVFSKDYDEAMRLLGLGTELQGEGKYSQADEVFLQAKAIFIQLGDYKEGPSKAEEAQDFMDYGRARQLFDSGNYEDAWIEFERLVPFKDSQDFANEARYIHAVQLYDDGKYDEASILFVNLGDYKDSKTYLAGAFLPSVTEMQSAIYDKALEYFEKGDYEHALIELRKLDDSYKDTSGLIEKSEELLSLRSRLSHTISAGIRYTVGVNADGTVISTGYNVDGQSEIGDWTDIVSISGLGIVTIGLKADGSVVTTSVPISAGVIIDTSGWRNIVAVAAGERYVVGLTAEGGIVGDGHDAGDNQLKFNDDWTHDIFAIATGWRHTVALKADGKILITGYGSASQLKEIEEHKDEWTDIVAIAAGGGELGRGHTVGLRKDGKVVAVGDNSRNQCDVDDWTDIIAIAAGDWHTVGLKSDGTVVATGNDGTEDFDSYKNCCSVGDWENIVAISAGSGSTIGLAFDGTVRTAGYGDFEKTSKAGEWHDIKVYDEWKAHISV